MAATDRAALQALYAERWADPDAREALASIQPDGRLRQTACHRLADTIDLAHGLAPERWGLSCQPGFVRLNVGPAEAVCLDEYGVRIMVHEPTVQADGIADLLPALSATTSGSFRSVPDSVYVTFPWTLEYERLDSALELFMPAHEEHIAIAVRSGLNGMTRRGHHPGLVDAIGLVVGDALPQPAYVRVPPPQPIEASASTPLASRSEVGVEGRRQTVTLSRVERSRALRRACIDQFGTRCQVCEIDLEERYGPIAAGLIHVHHLHPASDGERETDAVRDLRPVCPNCHLVIHAGGELRSIEEVQRMMTAARRRADA